MQGRRTHPPTQHNTTQRTHTHNTLTRTTYPAPTTQLRRQFVVWPTPPEQHAHNMTSGQTAHVCVHRTPTFTITKGRGRGRTATARTCARDASLSSLSASAACRSFTRSSSSKIRSCRFGPTAAATGLVTSVPWAWVPLCNGNGMGNRLQRASRGVGGEWWGGVLACNIAKAGRPLDPCTGVRAQQTRTHAVTHSHARTTGSPTTAAAHPVR